MSYPVYHGTRLAGPAHLQWLGLAVAIVALPIFLAAGWSVGGWAVGVGFFLANKLAALAIDRIARGKGEVTAVGLTGMGLISRAWITFGALFVVAKLWDREIGLAAAVVFLVCFTVDFVVRAVTQVIARGQDRPAGEAL